MLAGMVKYYACGLLCALLTIACIPSAVLADQEGVAQAPDSPPQFYLGEGVTEEHVAAVLAYMDQAYEGHPIPSGTAVVIEIVSEAQWALGEYQDGGWGSELPEGFQVRALDDPANPYREQYEDWDIWEYENYLWLCDEYGFDELTAEERMDFVYAQHDDPRLPNDQQHSITVRGDGYLIPHVLASAAMDRQNSFEESVIRFAGAVEHEGIWLSYDVTTAFVIDTIGDMPEQLRERMRRAACQARAAALPAVPQWLADDPPMWVMFIPDDEIVTLGPLGSWDDEEALSSSTWYRFSQKGELLGQTTPGQQEWFEIFFPGFQQVWENLGGIPDVQFSVIDGVISFYQQDTGEPLASYSYKGEEKPDPLGWYDQPSLFEIFEGRDIPAIYERQQDPEGSDC